MLIPFFVIEVYEIDQDLLPGSEQVLVKLIDRNLYQDENFYSNLDHIFDPAYSLCDIDNKHLKILAESIPVQSTIMKFD